MSAARETPRRSAARLLLAVSAGALAPGCDGCRGEKPYTPFGVTSALPSGSAPPPEPSAAPSASAAKTPTPAKKAAFAPNAAQRWTFEGRELESPEGRVFEQGLAADFDADGEREIATWTLPAPDAKDAAPGELWLYPASGPARKLLDFPSFLPTGAGCSPIAALAQSAARTLTVDVRVTCSTQLVRRAPTRALAVVEPLGPRPLRFGLRAADSAPGETLSLELTAGDEDGDGREDYRLSGSVTKSSAPAEITASLVFLDRAAGVSRDARQPVKGLLELAQKDVARATKKKTADAALEHVELTRRLLASLCAEGATPRVFDWSGAALPCGSLAEIADRLHVAEVNARLALGQFARALAALGRNGWYFGSLRAASAAQLSKEIEKRVPTQPASRTVLGARPKLEREPSLSPLRFDSDGALLILTSSAIFRAPSDGGREEPLPTDTQLTPWPLAALDSRGAHWLGVSYSCDRSEIELLFGGSSSDPLVVPLLAPRPGVCGGGRFDANFTASPAELGPPLRALVGGEVLGEKSNTPPPAGSALSPNGKFLALPTPLGLFIDGPSPELWKIDGWGPESKAGCVIDDTGRRAACVRAGRAELYVRAAQVTAP